MSGALDAPLSPRLLVHVGVEVIEMDVFGGKFSTGSGSGRAVTTVGHVIPAGFGLVGEHDVGAVMPSEPAGHLVREGEDVLFGVVVEPVVHWGVTVISMDVDVTRELSFQTGEHVIERKSVGRQMDPPGVGRKQSKGVSGPETIRLTPDRDVGLLLAGVGSKVVHVVFPGELFGVQVLLEDCTPLGVRDAGVKGLEGAVDVVLC